MKREELSALGLDEAQIQGVLPQFERLEGEISRLSAQISRQERDGEIKKALEPYRPRDPELMLRLIDGEDMSAIHEQIARLKAENPYLFRDHPNPSGGRADSGCDLDRCDMNSFLRGEK